MATIVRRDLYTIEIDGTRVRATPEQEERIREMTPEQLERFVNIFSKEQS